jgi:hypothetical protein
MENMCLLWTLFGAFFQSVFIGEASTNPSKQGVFLHFLRRSCRSGAALARPSSGSHSSHCCRGARKVAVWVRPSRKPDKFGWLRVSARTKAKERKGKREVRTFAQSPTAFCYIYVYVFRHTPLPRVLKCVSGRSRKNITRTDSPDTWLWRREGTSEKSEGGKNGGWRDTVGNWFALTAGSRLKSVVVVIW